MRKFDLKTLGIVFLMLVTTSINAFAHAIPNPAVTRIIAGFSVKGTVVDNADGAALIGATVQIKGTTRGTITDAEGRFSLDQVNEGDILVFRYMGYREIEYVVPKTADALIVDIRLHVDLQVFGAVAVSDEVYKPKSIF